MKTFRYLFSLFFCFYSVVVVAQQDDVSILNDIIAHLIGPQDNPDIPVYESIDEVCNSDYISCNSKDEIIGFNFQFANLNGEIPATLSKLAKLEWVNLEYNYLKGTIPSELTQLSKLEELILNGNFLTGPIPGKLKQNYNNFFIDLSQNIIEEDDSEIISKLNIVDQVNLEGCRSPDSIYLNKNINVRKSEISIDTDSIKSVMKHKEGAVEIFKVVNTMPRFPGCEEGDMSEQEMENCAKEKMLNYIYRNLKYPSLAREKGTEGMAVLQFVVLEDGSIGEVNLVRNPGSRTGNAGLWIINRMNYICQKWSPGKQNGRPVKVLYTLPIKFKLE